MFCTGSELLPAWMFWEACLGSKFAFFRKWKNVTQKVCMSCLGPSYYVWLDLRWPLLRIGHSKIHIVCWVHCGSIMSWMARRNVHLVPIIVNWASTRKLQESDSCFCSMFSCIRKNMVHQLFDKDFHCIFALWLDSRWNVVQNVPQLWVWGRLAGKLGQPGFSRSLHHHILCTT